MLGNFCCRFLYSNKFVVCDVSRQKTHAERWLITNSAKRYQGRGQLVSPKTWAYTFVSVHLTFRDSMTRELQKTLGKISQAPTSQKADYVLGHYVLIKNTFR